MDTKTLYDACNEAGINMRDEDSCDARWIALKLILGADNDFAELHIDWIAEAMCGRDRSDEDKVLTDRFLKNMMGAFDDSEFLSGRREVNTLFTTYAGAFVYHLTNVGEAAFNIIRPRAEKYVDDNIDEWWGDVQAYAGDMEAGAREDYEYENWRDRQMERE